MLRKENDARESTDNIYLAAFVALSGQPKETVSTHLGVGENNLTLVKII